MDNVKTYIMVDGEQRPAEMQPPQSDLQAAFTMGGTVAKPKIVIDMVAALPIAQDMVRQARAPFFAKVDGDRALAFDNDDSAARDNVREKAQQLRDAPADPRLAAATTPDELLAAVDAIVAEF